MDLHRARNQLRGRLEVLEVRLTTSPGDDGLWREYLAALDLFLRLEDRLHGRDAEPLLTTREMAARLGVSVKALLARKKRGVLRPSVAHGKNLRWRLQDAFRSG